MKIHIEGEVNFKKVGLVIGVIAIAGLAGVAIRNSIIKSHDEYCSDLYSRHVYAFSLPWRDQVATGAYDAGLKLYQRYLNECKGHS